jgi:hypothetical protein
MINFSGDIQKNSVFHITVLIEFSGHLLSAPTVGADTGDTRLLHDQS